jgi:hypothetical protein
MSLVDDNASAYATVLVVFARGDGLARTAHLDLSVCWDREDLHTEYGGKISETFNQALRRAHSRTWHVLGCPAFLGGLRWGLRPELGNIDGGSLYGPLAMGMLQALAKAPPKAIESGMRRQFLELIPQFRNASLAKVAVTAEGDEATGDFRPVGGIRQKLQKLAELKNDELVACIVAWDQDLPPDLLEAHHPNTNQGRSDIHFDWLRSPGQRTAIIRAHDPVDAFCRLWEIQRRSAIGRIV